LSLIAFCLCFRDQIVAVYIEDANVRELASASLSACSLVFLLDSMQQIMQGIIKGLGVQEGAQSSALWSFCAISLPMAYYFGFKLEWGLPGIWYGYSIGLINLNVLYAILIFQSSDWDEISRGIILEAQKALQLSKKTLLFEEDLSISKQSSSVDPEIEAVPSKVKSTNLNTKC